MNYPINKILFPTDFSDTAQNAFVHCVFIAGEVGADIELLHAIYPEYEAMDLPVMAAKATKDKVEAARATLQNFKEYALQEVAKYRKLKYQPNITVEVEVGGPVNVISNLARRDEADLIMMGTRGEHNTLDRAFGSVTTGVMERVECPVMVIPEKAVYQDIDIAAYGTDLIEADPYHIWKVGQMLEPFNPILHVVHVKTGRDQGEVNLGELEDFFANNAPALQINFHHYPADSVEAGLEDFVETYDVDMLVMYAPEHSLFERIFARSRTRKMAYQTHVPLLVFKT